MGLFAVAYWEARARRISTKDDVVSELGVRVVGEIPWVNWAAGPDAPSQLIESIETFRPFLVGHPGDWPSGRVLMVTSAVAQEGKTTLASHLALSVAQSGQRTLLIDADLRRPALHDVMGVPPGPGLSDVVLGRAAVKDTILPGPVPGLSVIPAGLARDEVTHTDLSLGLRAALGELRGHFDLVLIDCSPVLPVADALVIGRWVDGVLLSVRPRQSQLTLVAAACERMAGLRLPIVGAVVNGVRKWRSGYKYNSLPLEVSA